MEEGTIWRSGEARRRSRERGKRRGEGGRGGGGSCGRRQTQTGKLKVFYSCNFSYIQYRVLWIRIHGFSLVLVAWIQIQVGKKTQKKKNVKEFIDLMCWTCMFSFEGNFSYIQSCGSGSMDPHCFGRLKPGADSGGQKLPTGPQDKG